MLHEQISPIFKDLLKKYKKQYFDGKRDNDFHFKFGNLFRKKTINLGSWKKIIDDFKHKQDSNILEEFRKCLLTNLENLLLEQIAKACKYLTILRNPLSHRENISIKNFMDLRIEIITLLNPTFFFPL